MLNLSTRITHEMSQGLTKLAISSGAAAVSGPGADTKCNSLLKCLYCYVAVELWQQLEDLGLKRDERPAAFQSNMQGQLDLLVKQR